METNTQQERAKRLEQQAREYLMQSNDPIFTRYLQQLLPRIQRQPEYVEQLQAELDKSVEFWYQRQQINANRGGETGAESSVPQQSVPQEAVFFPGNFIHSFSLDFKTFSLIKVNCTCILLVNI